MTSKGDRHKYNDWYNKRCEEVVKLLREVRKGVIKEVKS